GTSSTSSMKWTSQCSPLPGNPGLPTPENTELPGNVEHQLDDADEPVLVPPGRCYPSRAHLAVIGSRRSRPKPRCVTRGPIGAWRRLYSLRSTRVSTLCTSSAS